MRWLQNLDSNMINLKDKILKFLSIDVTVDQYVTLKEEHALLKSEIDTLATEYSKKSVQFKKAIEDPSNTEILDILKSKENLYTVDHITAIADVQKRYKFLNSKIESVETNHPEIKKAVEVVKQREAFAEIKKAYKSGVLSLTQYNDIIKAKITQIEYADVIVTDKEGNILFLHRKKESSFEPQKWETPGGHVDVGETALEAAQRELEEETGITAKPKDLKFLGEHTGKDCFITYYTLTVDVQPEVTLAGDEHDDYTWTPLTEMVADEMILDSYNVLCNLLGIKEPDRVKIQKSYKIIIGLYKEGQISKDLFLTATDNFFKATGHKYIRKTPDIKDAAIKKAEDEELINGKFDAKEIKSFSHLFGKPIPSVDDLDTFVLYKVVKESGEDLDDWVADLPVENVKIADLIPTQDFIDWDKLAEKFKQKKDKQKHPFIVKKDGKLYIMDGHHRSGADKLNGDTDIDVYLFEDEEEGYTEEQLQDLITEHETLVPLLEKYNEPDLQAEAKKQKTELEQYKASLKALQNDKDVKKAFTIINTAFQKGELEAEIFHKAIKNYRDNYFNRKLKRVGQQYGKEAKKKEVDTTINDLADKFNNFNEYADLFKDFEKQKNKVPALKNIATKDLISLVGDTPAKGLKFLNKGDIFFHQFGDNQNGNIQISLKNDKFYYTRILDIKDGKLVSMENNSIDVFTKKEGLGTKIFLNQVKAAKKLGIKEFTCKAAKGDEYNGYYTWARLGYTFAKDEAQTKFNNVINFSNDPKIQDCKSISALMRFKKGREFWKKNGFEFQAKFDLSDDSLSMQTLNAYSKYKFKNV